MNPWDQWFEKSNPVSTIGERSFDEVQSVFERLYLINKQHMDAPLYR